MRVVKCVVQSYTATDEILNRLQDFRMMLNDCIRIGIRENLTAMRSLTSKAYQQLSHYEMATCYRLTAISKATGILKNYRRSLRKNPRTRIPYVKRLGLVDCYRFRIQDKRLRITLRPHEYAYIDLNSHTLEAIAACACRSVTLTSENLSICYSKDIEERKPRGLVGIDNNLDNITIASSDGRVKRFDLSKATLIKEIYRKVKSHVKRNDVRIRRHVFRKYGILQRNRVGWILNNVSASVVKDAKKNGLGIVMEDLKGMRKLFRKGNGKSRNYRARLNSWSYHEFQRQVEYKARWEGIPVIYVAAWGTSAKCSTCGSKTFPNENRTLYCQMCKTTVDRDVNAALNILAKGALRFGADGFAGEAMKKNETTTRPPSRCGPVDLRKRCEFRVDRT